MTTYSGELSEVNSMNPFAQLYVTALTALHHTRTNQKHHRLRESIIDATQDAIDEFNPDKTLIEQGLLTYDIAYHFLAQLISADLETSAMAICDDSLGSAYN